MFNAVKQSHFCHSGAPRSGEPGIQTVAKRRLVLDSGFTRFARDPE
jgi:hypothetical protein